MEMRSYMTHSLALLVACATLLSVSTVPAAAGLIAGVSASASSERSAGTLASRTTDKSGLAAGQHDVEFQQHWFNDTASESLADAFIQWDLGSAYILSSIQAWNLNQDTGALGDLTDHGINQVDIYYSSLAAPGDPEGAGAANWTLLQADATLSQSSGVNTYSGFDLATEIGTALPAGPVRWLRFEIDTNHGGSGQNFEVGFSEIEFNGSLPAPEPSALLLAVFGLLGLMTRRSRVR